MNSRGNKKSPVSRRDRGKLASGGLGHPENLALYEAAKRRQDAISAYIVVNHPEMVKEIDALRSCGSWLLFDYYPTVNKHRLAGGCTCKKHCLCPACALRRASLLVKVYEQLFRHLLKENPHLVPVLITYTVKNGPDLAERYAHITKARQTLHQYRRNALSSKNTARGRSSDTVLKHVHAAAGSYEFKKGKGSGDWHPHIHEVALLDSREFEFSEEVRTKKIYKNGSWHEITKTVQVPNEMRSQLCQEWWMLTGDSFVVDVVRLFPNSNQLSSDDQNAVRRQAELACGSALSGQQEDDDHSLFSGLAEAFKYALKMSTMELPDLIHAYLTLKRKRLVYSYGDVRKVDLPDESIDETEANLADLFRIQMLYRWAYSEGYILSQVFSADEVVTRPFPKKQRAAPVPRRKNYDSNVFKESVKKFIRDRLVVPSATSPPPARKAPPPISGGGATEEQLP